MTTRLGQSSDFTFQQPGLQDEQGDDDSIVLDVTILTPDLEEFKPEYHALEPSPDVSVKEPAPTVVGGGMLEGASEFWEEHKTKIMVGGGLLAAFGLWLKLKK